MMGSDVIISGSARYLLAKEGVKIGSTIWSLDFTEHDKPYKDEIKELKEQIEELEAELETKDNLLKIKNGLTGDSEDTPIAAAKDIIDKYYDNDIEQIVGHLEVYLKRDVF